MLEHIWKMNHSVRVEAKGANNLFAFYFGNEEDRQKVYSEGLCVIRKQLLSSVKPRVENISDMNFSLVSFWVQIHVPMACEDEECARFLGKLIGSVKNVDLAGPIMRVCVRIDVTKPLKQGIRIFMDEVMAEITLILHYE